jgi:uncharacterized protein YqgC (DUF456 family)
VTPVVRKVVDWVVGLTLILLGMLGGLIPFLPGWVLVFAGLAVLSSHNRYAHAIHVWMKERGRKMKEWVADKRDQREGD